MMKGYFISGPLGLGFPAAFHHRPGRRSSADVGRRGNCVGHLQRRDLQLQGTARRAAEQRAISFRTNSDTEVIIHGYKEWGTDVFNHLNGMFGVAIWDVMNERLVVARDAMGIKLVYYRIADGQLTFGSEIRAILAAENSKPEVDPVALNLFLRFRYTPSPLTIFEGIRKLAPGTMLVLENGKCREERWYNYTPMPFSSRREEKTGGRRTSGIVSRSG